MKILLTTEYFPPFAPGGTPWSTLYMGKALSEAGHEVQVFTPNYGAPSSETMEGIKVVRYPFWKTLAPGNNMVHLWQHVNPIFQLYSAYKLFAHARNSRPDVIHVQEKHSFFFSWVAGKFLDIPVFLTLRDMGFLCPIATCLLDNEKVPSDCGHLKLHTECAEFFNDHYAHKSFISKFVMKLWLQFLFLDIRFKRMFFKWTRGVFGVSNAILDLYGPHLKETPKQKVLYNLPPSARKNDETSAGQVPQFPNQPVVLYVGKLSLGKGFPVFLEAAKLLGTQYPDAVFAVAGKSKEDWGAMPPNVKLLGQLNQSQLAQVYQQCSMVVLPSVWPEPFSRVPLEAAAAGKPCIGTNKGGTPEIIEHDVTGLLVKPSDPMALADAIKSLLVSPERAKTLGANAKEKINKRFSPNAWLDELLREYSSRPRVVGVLASMGGIRTMKDAGQHERLLGYDLHYYAQRFDHVYYFSYLSERLEDYTDDPLLLKKVTLIPKPRWIPRKLYAFVMPLAQRKWIRKCDVLRAYQLTGVVPAVLTKAIFRIPFVTTYGYDYAAFERINGRALKAKAYEMLTKFVIPRADGVLVTTDEIHSRLLKDFDRPNIGLVPNGVDTNQFSIGHVKPQNVYDLLFVGRLETQKNLLNFIQALSKVRADRNIRLTLIGDGSLRELLQHKAREHSVDVVFEGVLKHTDLPERMRRAHMFVLPSLKEGHPKALLEAMACGLPCAVSSTAGVSETVVKAKAGLLMDPSSLESMSGVVQAMLDNTTARDEWGRNARAWAVNHFDIKSLMDAEIEFVAGCAAGNR